MVFKSTGGGGGGGCNKPLCDKCSQWQHRLCITGKTFLSNCILFNLPNYKQKIKKCCILKALSISSVTHTNTHIIIGNATTKYEEFLWVKSNKSVRFNEMEVPGLS